MRKRPARGISLTRTRFRSLSCVSLSPPSPTSGHLHDLSSDLSLRFLASPEFWLNPQFAHFLNQDTDIVAENFAERFVTHRDVRLAANVVPELRLNHRERRFGV